MSGQIQNAMDVEFRVKGAIAKRFKEIDSNIASRLGNCGTSVFDVAPEQFDAIKEMRLQKLVYERYLAEFNSDAADAETFQESLERIERMAIRELTHKALTEWQFLSSLPSHLDARHTLAAVAFVVSLFDDR